MKKKIIRILIAALVIGGTLTVGGYDVRNVCAVDDDKPNNKEPEAGDSGSGNSENQDSGTTKKVTPGTGTQKKVTPGTGTQKVEPAKDNTEGYDSDRVEQVIATNKKNSDGNPIYKVFFFKNITQEYEDGDITASLKDYNAESETPSVENVQSEKETGIDLVLILSSSTSTDDASFKSIKDQISNFSLKENDTLTLYVLKGNGYEKIIDKSGINDKDEIKASVDGIEEDSGETSFLDSIGKISEEIEQSNSDSDRRKVLVLLSNGSDSSFSSDEDNDEKLNNLYKSNYPLYMVQLKGEPEQDKNSIDYLKNRIKNELSGGINIVQDTRNTDSLSSVYTNITDNCWSGEFVWSKSESNSSEDVSDAEKYSFSILLKFPDAVSREKKYYDTSDTTDEVVSDSSDDDSEDTSTDENDDIKESEDTDSDSTTASSEKATTEATTESSEDATTESTSNGAEKLIDSVKNKDKNKDSGSIKDIFSNNKGLIAIIAAVAVIVLIVIIIISNAKRSKEASRRPSRPTPNNQPKSSGNARSVSGSPRTASSVSQSAASRPAASSRPVTSANTASSRPVSGSATTASQQTTASRPAAQNKPMRASDRLMAARQRDASEPSVKVKDQQQSLSGIKQIMIEMDIYQNGELLNKVNYPLDGSCIVGRGDVCDIVIEDNSISRQHFAIEYDGESLYIQNLSSSNGTLFNGVRITHKRRMESGDKIKAGSLVIIVRW